MLRGIGNSPVKSVESALKKRKATVERICRRGRFKAGREKWGSDG